MKLEHLKMIRIYFVKHSKTLHEHYLFAIVDEEIKRLTIAQQKLSGSTEVSPKSCPNCGVVRDYNEIHDVCPMCGHDFR